MWVKLVINKGRVYDKRSFKARELVSLFSLILKCVKISNVVWASWKGSRVTQLFGSPPDISASVCISDCSQASMFKVSSARPLPDLGSLPHPLVGHPPWIYFIALHCIAVSITQCPVHCNALCTCWTPTSNKLSCITTSNALLECAIQFYAMHC